jgi:hypothetical protein
VVLVDGLPTGYRAEAGVAMGSLGTQQLSEVRQGRFLLQGFAGNAAPDHVDLLHALPDLLRRLR